MDAPSAQLLATTTHADEATLVTTHDHEKCKTIIPYYSDPFSFPSNTTTVTAKTDACEDASKNGVRGVFIGRSIQDVIVQYVDLPSTIISMQAKKAKPDLCRRLKAQYFKIRMAGTNSPHHVGSNILQTLSGRIIS